MAATHIAQRTPGAYPPPPPPLSPPRSKPFPLPAKFEEGTIVVTRPLHELWGHITACELPSWTLIARAISTLFMAIFRWHLCDGIMLLRGEGFYHNSQGHVEMIASTGKELAALANIIRPYFTQNDWQTINTLYPHALSTALLLRCRDAVPVAQSPANHALKNMELHLATKMQAILIPDFDNYAELTAQTVRSYFAQAYRKEITDQEEGNTLWTLVTSDRLEAVTNETIRTLYGQHTGAQP